MSKQYYKFAVGWLKEKDGRQYISGSANKDAEEPKLLAELPDGTIIPVNSFFMNFNEFKGQKPKNAPDVKFVFTVESD